ncbi:MAG: hypothetical protein RLW61_21385 [Gammaproteobacteria bacterium]
MSSNALIKKSLEVLPQVAGLLLVFHLVVTTSPAVAAPASADPTHQHAALTTRMV